MLPAYGRELLQVRRDGKRPAQLVYVVGNWELARELRARDRFVLMVEGDPDKYGFSRFPRFDFSMLQDLDVAIVPDSLEWIGIIIPQVRAARPIRVRNTTIFYPGFSKQAPQYAVEIIASFEADLSAA